MSGKKKKQVKKDGEFLLETGFEEIPAEYLKPAAKQLDSDMRKLLDENRLTYKKISVYYTVRRFVVYAKGMALKQPDLSYEKKGPRHDIAYKDGKLTDVGRNFLTKSGIKEKDINIKEEKGHRFVYVNVFEKGRAAEAVLKEKLGPLINSLKFPKSMTWDDSKVSFARPVRWIMCLLNSKTVSFSFGKIKSSNRTKAHKYLLNEKPVAVKSAAAYFSTVKKNKIIISQEDRKKEILKKSASLLSKKKLRIINDDELLEKVASSVEAVSVMLGEFDKKYLFLPEEVIITAMREHQRYFGVSKSGKFTSYFINVRDGGEKNNAFIAKQHAKVLFARLDDAAFFYNEDLKTPLENNIPKLKDSIFITGLGSMFEKVERMKMVAEKSGELFNYRDTAVLKEAIHLSKADLETNMISEKEFVFLRGFMGGVYLIKQGKDEKVCAAVSEHYYPGFTGDRLPSTTEGVLLSLLDKIDNVCGFFIAGYKPTGSKDPYAVRRQALNIIYIVLEKKLDIDLFVLINSVSSAYSGQMGKKLNVGEVVEFFRQREKNYFKEMKIDYDIINSLAAGEGLNIGDDYKKAEILMRERKSKDFNSIIFAVSRISNILPKGFRPEAVKKELFESHEEGMLYEKFLENKGKIKSLIYSGRHKECFDLIASFKPEIDAYFDKVLVNTDDAERKRNRLSMLDEMKNTFFKFVKFSDIVVDRK